MKLRNKKTGEVFDVLISAYGISGDVAVSVMGSNTESVYADLGRYKTLAELNKEWEDYKPAEPLIKDGKARKAIRAWAEAEWIEEVAVMCHLAWGEKMTEIAKISNAKQEITFKGDLGVKTGNYTIAELCGEEEK